MLQNLNYLTPVASFIIGFLVYERLIKKDANQSATLMAVLMTKVDMLLSNSLDAQKDIKEHTKQINEHTVKIEDLEKTLSFKLKERE